MMTENDYARYTAEQVAKGREEGREEERLIIARALLAKGSDIKLISEVTGLSEEDVKALK